MCSTMAYCIHHPLKKNFVIFMNNTFIVLHDHLQRSSKLLVNLRLLVNKRLWCQSITVHHIRATDKQLGMHLSSSLKLRFSEHEKYDETHKVIDFRTRRKHARKQPIFRWIWNISKGSLFRPLQAFMCDLCANGKLCVSARGKCTRKKYQPCLI